MTEILHVYIYMYLLHTTAVFVNFTETQYDVMESDGMVEICVELYGQLEDTIAVQLSTIPGTAESEWYYSYYWYLIWHWLECIHTASLDYTSVYENLVFNESGVQCYNITILMDDTVESEETFSVVLTSQDSRVDVDVEEYWVPVTIADSNG